MSANLYEVVRIRHERDDARDYIVARPCLRVAQRGELGDLEIRGFVPNAFVRTGDLLSVELVEE